VRAAGDVRGRLRLGGEETIADLVETRICFQEPACHLRLPGEAAKIDHRAGVGDGLGTDVGSIDNGDGTGGIWGHRRRTGIRGRIGLGSGRIHMYRYVVPRDTVRIGVGRGLCWRRVNICFRSARRFILSRIARTLIDKGYLYRLLNNRVYRGEALHKGKSYPGEHAAVIDAGLWDQVHAILQESPRKRANNSRAQTPALLKGLIFGESGAAMTPTSTKKAAKLYRYYVSMDVIRNRETGEETAPMRLAAGMVEDAVVTEIRRILQTPEVLTQVLAALKRDSSSTSEADAIAALHEFNALWSQLFPAEQARIIQLLVRRVTVTTAGLEVDIRREGIAGVIREMVAPRRMEAAE
jgi:hypothetical protein